MSLEDQIDSIYDQVDTMIWIKEFGVLDAMFQILNTDDLSLDISLAYLTASAPVKSKLPNRARFFKDFKAKCQSLWEEDAVWKGLE